jgi:hypothetical protein
MNILILKYNNKEIPAPFVTSVSAAFPLVYTLQSAIAAFVAVLIILLSRCFVT